MAKKKNDKKSIEKNKSDVATIGNELKKVSWPKAGELSKATASVIFLVVIVALIIFLSDSLFSFGFKKVTEPIIAKQKKDIGTNTSSSEKTKTEEKKSEENKEDKKEENKEDKKEGNKEQQ